ncbi:helix-turn-helix domain-containing protein [Acinetobacter sp. YH01024]|uniref:helix-turn-helix domain-containing protein n=1 Tax=Acinetobacter sp. YH01024 TaxID=2601037 RepID=UPI0015D10E49|nr:helix-turn-helix domain-containing protein [Acinetobacter sp. YH01024]
MASREEIGKEIRLARKALGYTQKNLSEKTNVNKTTISEIENGHFTGSFSIFESILNAVGLQFEVNKNKYKFPHWDEIEAMIAEDDE